MNNNRHKIVFNRRRGILMAVAETAVGQGKSPGERSGGETGGGNGSLKTHSGCRLHLGTLAFSLLLGFGSALIVPAAAADIQADKSAPKSQQPVILQTGNGLPQVNIQTPTAHGVSVNQYRRFDVDTRGTILNNSHKSVSTRQAGWIQGNPFLARGEARVIVNQINSSDPSRLEGYIEIAGRRAEVVMANPAGIRVDGGGFINSAGATLTTGRPILADGRFDGLDIGSGRIEIGAQGLDGRDADYTRILSRAAKIDGGIWGQDIQVIAAGGQTDAAGSVKTPSAAGNPPSAGGTPVFAIDTGALGGMYAPNGQDIIRIKNCPLLDKSHEKIVGAVSGALSYLSGSHELDIERIGIRASRRTKDVEVALWTAPGGFPRAQVARVLKDATGATSIVRVITKGPSSPMARLRDRLIK